tara:strand:- start:3913 stop:4488 length:576 start_codon:yes stop_codon:yes gene_type:complete
MRLWLGLALVGGLLGCAVVDNAVDRTRMSVQGSRLLISGEITSRTPRAFEALLEAHPDVRTLVPEIMQGSLDDQAVLRMGYFLRDRGMDTHLTAQSEIYSGAVDLFLAGNRRSMARGAVIGVHSWADGFGEGTGYPRDAREHAGNVAYFRDMLGSDAFYWFTLQAAPSSGIHEMTPGEIARFGLLTEPVRD